LAPKGYSTGHRATAAEMPLRAGGVQRNIASNAAVIYAS